MAVQIEQIPFSAHLGMQLQSSCEGRSSCTVPLRPEHLNSNGFAHGGLTFSLSDTCMGQAVATMLAHGERAVTVESKMNYFRPGSGELLRSESEVVHRGRSLANVECRIWAGDRLVATANGTFAILRVPDNPAA